MKRGRKKQKFEILSTNAATANSPMYANIRDVPSVDNGYMAKKARIGYISDLHLEHHAATLNGVVDKNNVRKIATALYRSAKSQHCELVIFAGDMFESVDTAVAFFNVWRALANCPRYKSYKKASEFIRGITCDKKAYQRFRNYIIQELIKAGLSEDDYKKILVSPRKFPERIVELRRLAKQVREKNDKLCEISKQNPLFEMKETCGLNVLYVLGNHEFAHKNYAEAVELYKTRLSKYGVVVLENSAVRYGDMCFLGMCGTPLYNERYNSSNLIVANDFATNPDFEKQLSQSYEDKARQFSEYTKETKGVAFVITHHPVDDFISDAAALFNGSILFSGHTHRQNVIPGKLYADNQIGYKNAEYGIMVAEAPVSVNPFECYDDGYFEVDEDDYLQFLKFNSHYGQAKIIRKRFLRGEKMWLVKKGGFVAFFMLGGKHDVIVYGKVAYKTRGKHDVQYYYDNIEKMILFLYNGFYRIHELQGRISDELIDAGYDGHIHGLIVDIDYYNHVMVNPFDGTVTAYNSPFYGYISSAYKSIPELIVGEKLAITDGVLKNYPAVTNVNPSPIGTNELIDIKESMYAYSIRYSRISLLFKSGWLGLWQDSVLSNRPLVEREKDVLEVGDALSREDMEYGQKRR